MAVAARRLLRVCLALHLLQPSTCGGRAVAPAQRRCANASACVALLMRATSNPAWGGVACAALLAVKHVNERDGRVVANLSSGTTALPTGFNISAAIRDTHSNPIDALRALQDAHALGYTDAVVGAGYSSVSLAVAQRTAIMKIPQVSDEPGFGVAYKPCPGAAPTAAAGSTGLLLTRASARPRRFPTGPRRPSSVAASTLTSRGSWCRTR